MTPEYRLYRLEMAISAVRHKSPFTGTGLFGRVGELLDRVMDELESIRHDIVAEKEDS